LTLLVGRQEGHPACKKTERWGAGVVICLERGADLHTAELMPLPLTVSCFSKIQIGFAFLVPAHPGSPGQRAVKRVCECVCVLLTPAVHIITGISIGSAVLHGSQSQSDRLTLLPSVTRGRALIRHACMRCGLKRGRKTKDVTDTNTHGANRSSTLQHPHQR